MDRPEQQNQVQQQPPAPLADPAAGGQSQSWQAGSGDSLPAADQSGSGSDAANGTARKVVDEASPYKETGTLQDKDKLELLEMRNQFIKEQAEQGKETGLSLHKDKQDGHNKQETWGMQESILEPDEQN